MARLHVFAEGQTEQTFADVLLKPHLANLGVFMHYPVLAAHARRKGRIHRGGGRKYLPMKNDIARRLKEDKSKDVFFTTLIDLYAIHADFPGVAEAEKLRHEPLKRVQFLEAAFAADIGDSRFIPHIQLHEYEGYLFVDASKFADFYPSSDRQIAALQTDAAKFATPELINDGPHTAPSKRIIGQFPDYEHAKPVVGPQVAASIGLANIRAKCPHFNAWLTRLEGLGAASHAGSAI